MPNLRDASYGAILVLCVLQASVFRQTTPSTTTTAINNPTFPQHDNDGHALRECTQNPYLNALGPLGNITTEMDRWLGNVSAIGSESTAGYVTSFLEELASS
jgi:hypothetical protein